MKSLMLMETYSIIYHKCTETKIPHTYTKVENLRFDENLKRFIYKCSSKKLYHIISVAFSLWLNKKIIQLLSQ